MTWLAQCERCTESSILLRSLAVPTCVGIDGVAVGGGLELALSFDQLIATAQPKTKLGFQRLISASFGMGGSGRAFARTGTQAALDLMLTGQLITSKAAFDISLIDQIVENRDDLKIALDKWLNTQNGKKPKRQALENKANKNAVQAARELYLRQNPQRPHPCTI